MATASRVQLTTHEEPAFAVLQASTADKAQFASDLLQKNHDNYHIYFNHDGFHNHIAHHLLTTYALAASTKDLQYHFDSNKSYQRPMQPYDQAVVENMSDPAKFTKYLGDEKHYNDFLQFFQNDIDKQGWQATLNKYVFGENDLAHKILPLMFAGFLHPIIHLGFGVEFEQPAIIAEALAQAATHTNWIAKFLWSSEDAVRVNRSKPSKSMVELLDEIRNDKDLYNSVQMKDGNKVRDGVLARAGDRMISYAAQYHVKPSELEEKTAEMINGAAYFTGGAQRKDRDVKFDFFYMHCVNSSIFWPVFLKQSWLSEASKVRLLEWKVWNDLAMYVSRKSPEIHLDEIRNYKPKQPSDWTKVVERVRAHEDDGHASKMVRALAHGQQSCAPYDSKAEFRLKKDDWLQLAHMTIDSVENDGPTWVRSTGFDQAWEKVPLRSQL
ncbi:hypothetical protein WHR41_02789 [Cladosporium halotolerans]|uniref:HypA n=1 Tax=Cladosporium halotolerans TaxID=1052096 RepID=A0AB34KTJ6_9PEZI